MEPTLQGFIDFHGETIKSQYDLYIESLKPREDDIDTITNIMKKVKIDEKLENDDIDTITNSIDKVKIDEKPKNKGRKCSLCKEYGHNKRTCPTLKSDKPIKKVQKKKSEKKIVKVEFDCNDLRKEKYNLKYGECICDLCHTDFTNNMLTNHNDKNICYNCYKITVIDGITDFDLCINQNCKCPECQTIPLSPTESQSMNDLLTDDTNDYIIYEGVEYTFDDSTNIISYDYEELGIWNTSTETIQWYNDECESIHTKNKSL
jgi:formylmethanofuran dehydrogenase subunit E